MPPAAAPVPPSASRMKAKYSNASQSKPSACSAREHERGVADPRVAVVPVALAARGLRERRRSRGHDRPGWRVAEPLERERAALHVRAEVVVGEVRHAHPLAPEQLRGVELGERLVDARRPVPAPGERDVRGLAVLERGAAVGPGAEDPEREAALHLDRQVAGREQQPVVPGPVVAPLTDHAAVVEQGQAADEDLDAPTEAGRDAQQRSLRGRVAGDPPVVGAAPADVGRTHDEQVLHREPSGGRVPCRLEDVGAGDVPARVRHQRV